MLRSQMFLLAASAIGAASGSFFGLSKDEGPEKVYLTQSGMQPPAPPAATAAPYQKSSGSGLSSGAGFTYQDPLEGRVQDLESRISAIASRVETVSSTAPAVPLNQAASGSTASQAASGAPSGQVTSQTITQGSTGPLSAVTIRAGATPMEVAQNLQAMGYQATYSYGGVTYGSNGSVVSAPAYSYSAPSYGSTGSSASYGSGGSSMYASASYGSTGTQLASYSPAMDYGSYAAPVSYASYAQPASYASSYAAPVAAPVRTGLFGRRVARSASYGAYGAGATCRVVNGQLICN